ncbi:MAG: DNA-processing protein DprA [Oscillospiraceae bacterium]
MKTPSSVEVWLWLLLVMNPYNSKTAKLIRKYDSAEELCRAIRDGNCRNLSEAEKQRAATTRTREVRQIMEECAAHSIRIVTLDDPDYPTLLKNTYDPPIVLFVRGDITCFDGAVPLSVVGPRRPTDSAVNAARKVCSDLVKLGTVIVSGLAVGIDTVAHTCAVEQGAPTVGVLACGQLINYPTESEGLKQRILENGGAIISELLPHAAVIGSYFHHRNRIISGLGLGTVLIEASTRSGCLLTANHAVEQGRDLFCVPPSDITLERCAGVVDYLREGAYPVYDYLDIIRYYMPQYFGQDFAGESDEELRQMTSVTRRPKGKPVQPEKPQETPEKPAEPQKKAPDLSGLNELQSRLVQLINERPQSADELIAQTGTAYPEAVEALTELEISGLITLLPGGNYKTL